MNIARKVSTGSCPVSQQRSLRDAYPVPTWNLCLIGILMYDIEKLYCNSPMGWRTHRPCLSRTCLLCRRKSSKSCFLTINPQNLFCCRMDQLRFYASLHQGTHRRHELLCMTHRYVAADILALVAPSYFNKNYRYWNRCWKFDPTSLLCHKIRTNQLPIRPPQMSRQSQEIQSLHNWGTSK